MTDSNGLNVADDNYQFVFSLYSVASGGSAVWTETVNLDVADGIFHHALGSDTALPGSVDFNTDNIFLGITFDSDPDGEMEPRIQLTASPYAFNADQLDGLDASDFVQLNPSVAQTGDIDITGDITAGSIDISSTSNFDGQLTANGGVTAAGAITINLTDNTADILDIQEGSSNYININTTNSSENITFGNATTNPSYNFLGTGLVNIYGRAHILSSLTFGGGTGADIGTPDDSVSTDLTIAGGTSSSTFGAPQGNVTVRGGDITANGMVNIAGYLYLNGGNATGSSGTRRGGNVVIDAGTGASLNGQITLGANNASALTLGRTGLTTVVDGGLSVAEDASFENTLRISDNSSNYATITVDSLAGDYSVAIPTITANDTFCLENLANCAGGGDVNSDLTDNTADALDIQEGTNNYINISTVNGSEAISLGNATTNPDFSFLGSGTLTVAGAATITGQATFSDSIVTSGWMSMGNSVIAQKINLYENGNDRYGFGIASGQIRMYSSSGNNIVFGRASGTGGATFTESGRFNGSGYFNVGGDTTPNALFTVGSTSQLQVDTSGNLSTSGTLAVTGLATFNGDISISDGSGDYITITADSVSDDYTVTIPTITANDIFCLENLNNCGGGGGSLFTDGGSQTYLTSTTDELVLGSSSSVSSKLGIVGTSDQVQTLIQGNATQTSNILEIQNSAGSTTYLAVSGSGVLSVGSVASAESSPVLLVTNAEVQGTLYIGGSSGNIQNSGTGGALRFSGTARNDKTVTFNPEYEGAILSGSGTGYLTSSACGNQGDLSLNTGACASSQTHSYYEWTTSEGTSQTYSIYIVYQLPSDFAEFADNSTIKLFGRRTSNTASVAYTMYQADGTRCGSVTTVTSSNNTWQEVSLTGNEQSTCTFAAGDIVTFQINLAAQSSSVARVGRLSFTYKSVF